MQIIKLSENNRNRNGITKKGATFCIECGKEYYQKGDNCNVCGDSMFLIGPIAETLSGYIELSKRGELKKYYAKEMAKIKKDLPSKRIRMNEKRIVLYLLIHKDSFKIGDNNKMKALIDKIFTWKRYNSHVRFNN